MELTKDEKQLIEHYRNGASIRVAHHWLDTYKEVENVMEKARVLYISESPTNPVVIFSGRINQQIRLSAFLNK